MPQQGFSIGRDVTVIAILSDGTTLRFGKITGWNAKPEVTKVKVKGLDGSVNNLRFHEGWAGAFKCDRQNDGLDSYWSQVEANYYAGIEEDSCTIQQTIQEPDGSVSQYRFENAVLDYDDPGDWASDKTVSQSVSFAAARRIQQA